METVVVARVYDEPGDDDRARVLVDRVWPRGVRKEDLRFDEWAKDVAPSTELRAWYRHDPRKFEAFRTRYRRELGQPKRRAAVERLRELTRERPLTLLTATKDVTHSHAVVLAEVLSAQS